MCTVRSLLRKRHFCAQHKNSSLQFCRRSQLRLQTLFESKDLDEEKKQILENKIEKSFSPTTLMQILVFPEAKCFDRILDDSVLFCHLFEKNSFLIFNLEKLLRILPPKAGGLVCINLAEKKNVDGKNAEK